MSQVTAVTLDTYMPRKDTKQPILQITAFLNSPSHIVPPPRSLLLQDTKGS